MPKWNVQIHVLLLLAVTAGYSQFAVLPPEPILPIPTSRQIDWQDTELSLFIHFGVNTFTNREWGEGTENPQIFNPTDLDPRQWVRVASECGFERVILTAKHHDGFCLWPSKYTDHSVEKSPWRNGGGDVVRLFSEACRQYDVEMGLYLSPWDRHEPTYGDSPAYNAFYLAQLRELLTQYGPVYEMWFDGANGEGPNGKKQVYTFDAYWSLVRQLQPQAVMFSDIGPDVRWIGNEHGFAGETCWAMMDRGTMTIGDADQAYLNTGEIDGPDWVQGECDVSIRPGWFYHPDEDPKTVDELLDIYFKSVGRNGILLLNIPPNKKGLLDDKDVQRLYEFRDALTRIFQTDLALGKMASANQIRGDAKTFAAAQAFDGHPETFWATDDSLTSGWLEVDLGTPQSFNVIMVQEPIAYGQRIKAYNVQVWRNDQWEQVSEGTTIGRKKLDRIPLVTTQKLRINILDARACPLISNVGVFRSPY